MSTEPEDNPPLAPPYAGERSATIRPDPMTREQIDREMVKHEASRVAEVLAMLERLMPTLATKADLEPIVAKVDALDAAMGHVLERADQAETSLSNLDRHHANMAQEIRATRTEVKSMWEAAKSAIDIAMDAKLGTNGSHHNGNGHDPDSDDEDTRPDHLRVLRST